MSQALMLKHENSIDSSYFNIYEQFYFHNHTQLSRAQKKFLPRVLKIDCALCMNQYITIRVRLKRAA